jgi:hypothetical protein
MVKFAISGSRRENVIYFKIQFKPENRFDGIEIVLKAIYSDDPIETDL